MVLHHTAGILGKTLCFSIRLGRFCLDSHLPEQLHTCVSGRGVVNPEVLI